MPTIFYWGRVDQTLTIHTTKDCGNDCPFCVNKNYYRNDKNQPENCWSRKRQERLSIFENLHTILTTQDIRNIVITGGEPLDDLDFIADVILQIKTIVPSNKHINIYINTMMPESSTLNFFEFLKEFSSDITGISVSRPFGYEKIFTREVASKECVTRIWNEFNIDTRINVTLNKHKDDKNSFSIRTYLDYMYKEFCYEGKKLIDRKDIDNNHFSFNFRADFTKTTRYTLNRITGEDTDSIGSCNAKKIGGCRVCATYKLTTPENQVAFYHKGLRETSIPSTIGDVNFVEINDLIILPNGKVQYDWPKAAMYEFDTNVNKILSRDCLNNVMYEVFVNSKTSYIKLPSIPQEFQKTKYQIGDLPPGLVPAPTVDPSIYTPLGLKD